MTKYYTVSYDETIKQTEEWKHQETEILTLEDREDGTERTQMEILAEFGEVIRMRKQYQNTNPRFQKEVDMCSVTWKESPLQEYRVNIDFTCEPSRGSYEVEVKAVSEDHAREIAQEAFDGECASDHIEDWNDSCVEDTNYDFELIEKEKPMLKLVTPNKEEAAL